MPHCHPDADDSARGLDRAHYSYLKRKAEGISRSLSKVFAFLTHGTASLEEAKKLLSIIIWEFAPEDILGYDRICKDM
jgi:hypothetical protein